MDHANQRTLKEAFVQVQINEANKAQEQQLWNEVQAYSNELIREGYDLSEMTWDEMRESYLREFEDTSGYDLDKPEKKTNKPYAPGAMGQWQRTVDRLSGNKSRQNKAQSYDTSVNNIRKRRTNAGGNPTDKINQNDIDAETKGRRLADPKYRAGKGVDSGSKTTTNNNNSNNNNNNSNNNNNNNNNNRSNNNNSNNNSNSNSNSNSSQQSSQRPSAPAPAKQTGDKAKDMASWAKANPELAKRQKERQRTRGTSASSNPMMADLKSRAPKPSAPAPSTQTKSLTGNKAASFISKGGSKANQAPAKPTASPMKAGRLRSALDSVKKESTEFDLRLQQLLNQGFEHDDAMELMVREATKHIDDEEMARKKRKKKINKVTMCPTIDESILDVVFEEWIDDMLESGYDLSECYETDLFKAFLTQISEDAGTYRHLEYLGRISLEEASSLSVEDQLRVSNAYFAKRNSRSDEEKAAEKEKNAKDRARNYKANAKNRPDPYRSRAGESD